MLTSYNDYNIFLVSHILQLFQNKLAEYEKLGKYWQYCARNRAIITNAYFTYLKAREIIQRNIRNLECLFEIRNKKVIDSTVGVNLLSQAIKPVYVTGFFL